MLTWEHARSIVACTLEHARQNDLQPLAVAVLDQSGTLKRFEAEDGVSLGRAAIAQGKANGALAMGMGSRALAKAAREAPHFIQSLGTVLLGGIVPHVGGVLIRDSSNRILGAVGISGDRGDQDEAAAMAGITAAGFVVDPGKE
jgi:uncharacterized protein GlcG (DUF336 family)